ncbi:sensor domain-containing protein [Streptomyces sp. JJ36]|uniref:sensor domain-containing protein n=1 Tax=Streptomyces sp. JJ36 TaxID=2736645 RepID=UPI001F1AA7C2|nr:sensor domain-containing protein [Streptomyces sp. JJ36]MCF6524151.1 sensor domain-containing protein [Streptomyces sp. JJ36]
MGEKLRRTGLSAAAVAAALALVAGCGGDGGKDGAEGGGKDASAQEKPAAENAEPLTAAELEKRALKQGDVEGHRIEKATEKDLAEQPGAVKPASCRPVVDAIATAAAGDPAATVLRDAQEKPGGTPSLDENTTEEEMDRALEDALGATVVRMGLSTYEGKGAQGVLAEFREQLQGCEGTFTVNGTEQRVDSLTTDAPARGGDEAVTFSMVTTDEQGKEIPGSAFAVHRKGNVLAFFMAVSFTAEKKGDVQVPAALVEAQTAKLAG